VLVATVVLVAVLNGFTALSGSYELALTDGFGAFRPGGKDRYMANTDRLEQIVARLPEAMRVTAAASSLGSFTLMPVASGAAETKLLPFTRNVGSPSQASMSSRR